MVPQSYSEMIASWATSTRTPGQVTGVGRLEGRIRQTLPGAVGRDEVLEHGQPFPEIGGNGLLDDLTGRLGHQTAHAGQLLHLVLAAPRAPESAIMKMGLKLPPSSS